MKVRDLVDRLNLTVFAGHEGLDNEITGGYVSDLLSDVMGNVEDGNVWMTLQTHKNIMAIASLREVAAVVVVKGFMPDDAAIAQSKEEGIPLLGTSLETFNMAGQLYRLLNP
jgi:predicted transcriptional regulator